MENHLLMIFGHREKMNVNLDAAFYCHN